jgi:NADH-quinone oxidoreductase subunit B
MAAKKRYTPEEIAAIRERAGLPAVAAAPAAGAEGSAAVATAPAEGQEEIPAGARETGGLPARVHLDQETAKFAPVAPVQGKALYRALLPGIIQMPADTLIAAARKSSLWPLTFGLACCAIEMIGTFMSHHDLDRFGIVPWPSPRQADVMIVSGTVTKKMGPAVKLLYEQMPNPKWVISMGACATNGGPYTRYDRVVQGVDKLIPVDVYVPGCPPRPEALMDGFIALQEKIMEERGKVG